MTINLISQQTYDVLKEICAQFPKLTYQNKDYDGINRAELNALELDKIKEIETILFTAIDEFSRFQNFRINKANKLEIRFQYHWSNSFTGVGYLELDELLNGFKSVEVN